MLNLLVVTPKLTKLAGVLRIDISELLNHEIFGNTFNTLKDKTNRERNRPKH
jgi:hypothetical protein